MNNSSELPNLERTKFTGSLASTIARTLLFFTLIPLLLMAGASYFRARSLLREQVIEQNQRLIATQINNTDRSIKIKEIRLDRLSRKSDFISAMESALHANRQSTSFIGIRKNVLSQFNTLSEDGVSTFNELLLLTPDGIIQTSSNSEWEGLKIPVENLLDDAVDRRSLMTYDMKPLYPDQLALLTIVKYKTTGGSLLGLLVGVTESQNLQESLNSLVTLSPSSQAFYILPSEIMLTPNIYTKQLQIENTSASQKEAIATAIAVLNNTDTSFSADPISIEYDSIDGHHILAQAQWLPSINSGIVLATHEEEILSQLNGLTLFTLGLIAISLASMGLVIWAGSNRVIRPIRALANITHRFSKGDWSQRAEVLSTDEVGELSASFNQMADQLSEVYKSLEQKVDERTKELLIAAEVAQSIIASTSLDELLNKTVRLLVEQFGFYHAGVFLVDRAGKTATLRAAHSPAAEIMLANSHSLDVGSASIIGWVTANNKSKVVSDVSEDSIHFKNKYLPETRSEVGMPISVGNLIIGALDVQSKEPNAFGQETVNLVMLQTLANQIATAIQSIKLTESNQVNLQELERLYRASQVVAEAKTKASALEKTSNVLQNSPIPHVLLLINSNKFDVYSYTHEFFDKAKLNTAIDYLNSSMIDIKKILLLGTVVTSDKEAQKHTALNDFVNIFSGSSGVFLPIQSGDTLIGVMVMVASNQSLNYSSIQPYVNLMDLLRTTLEKIDSASITQLHLTEMEALTELSQVISVTSSLESFYESLHNQVRKLIGEYSFIIALYDEKTNSISIPYTYEDGVTSTIESFPLGQGLTSILIHTKQPLLLVEDTEKRAAELGAKIVGKPARSWMGAPLLVQNQPVGALIIQDPNQEHAFNEDNLRFFSALASQVAGVIHNVLLLDESQQRTLQLQTASEIARDISSSLNLDELLLKAVNLIRDRFNFYHASIFLIDSAGEFIAIREATGDAGIQLKRQDYKLAVGSKSIMGYVASHGEPLVVNDTNADATFLHNPLLPDTRAEATLPLKAGERILGVLDTQSSKPNVFTEDILRSLQILADQLSIGIANTELFAETQEHLSQHRLLHHITTTTASGTTLEEALESAVTGLQVSLGGDRVAILLADVEKKNIEVKAAIGYSEDVSKMVIQIGSGITGWVAAHRRPLRINNVLEDTRYIEASSNTRSELAIPLVYRNELLGVLNVESEKSGAYTENDQEMLGTLGGSLAAIIANARLLEQLRNQAERERMIYEITSKIRRSTDIETIMMTTASELMKAVGARHAKVTLSSPKDNSGETL